MAQTSMSDLHEGVIVFTNNSCVIRDRVRSGIPTLVWSDGVHEAASDWLRELVVVHGLAKSSVLEYAKIMRPFLRFCRDRKRGWDTVDDSFLLIWRSHLQDVECVSVRRINTVLTTIFAFYRWAEEKNRIRYRVGIYCEDELPDAMRGTAFPISAIQSFSKSQTGKVFGNWTTPLTLGGSETSSRLRHTPTELEIQGLHSVVAERSNGSRDSLMLSWAEEVGYRRAEILRVGKSHLPNLNELSGLIERDEPWTISVERKGGKSKPVIVPVELIIRTNDFIQFERSEIVSRCKRTLVGYSEPNEIFLSSRTGKALHPDSVTSIGRRIFHQAGITNANIHRLRARFAVRTVETLLDSVFDSHVIGSDSNWVETILIKAAELMGHADPRSLRPYLNYVLNRRLQTTDATKAERLSSKLRQLSLHEGTLLRRLNEVQELLHIASLLKSGKSSDASMALRSMAEQIDRAKSRHR